MRGFLRSLLTLPFQLSAFPQWGAVSGQTGAWSDASLLGGCATVDPREELVIRYAESRGEVLENGKFIRLGGVMFRPDGRRDGRYEGILETPGRVDRAALSAPPDSSPQETDQVEDSVSIASNGNVKITYFFGDQSTLTVIGLTVVSLVQLPDGSTLLMVSGAGRVTDGTGRYEGAQGMRSDVSSSHLPGGADLNQTGATFHSRTVHVFRLVRRQYRAPPFALKGGGGPGMARSDSRTRRGRQAASPPAELPSDGSAETYRPEVVQRQLKRAAYFTIFNVGNPGQPNTPILFSSGQMIGVEVNEDLHRFEVSVEEPSGAGSLRVANRLGEVIGSVHIRWLVVPDDFAAAPGRAPPPTPLDPRRGQRFVMLDGRLRLRDRQESGIDGFGSGRTYPVLASGKPQLRIGAVIDVLEGRGRLRGMNGTLTVNGTIEPPTGLALSLVGRFVDPRNKLEVRGRVAPLQEASGGDADSLFLAFLGEPTPDRYTPKGDSSTERPQELLRLVHVSFESGRGKDLGSKTVAGRVVGSVSGSLVFDPSERDPAIPIPLQTRDTVFTFWDRESRTIATLKANVVEGRAFRAEILGLSAATFRFGGFGPFLDGTGQFEGAEGMLSVNGVLSVRPSAFSNFYMLRVSDPQGRFREACRAAWS